MFTGLVECMGTVVDIVDESPGVRLRIDAGQVADDAVLGASVAINGCCLTVVAIENSILDFEAGSETLGRTNLGSLKIGIHVNLERSLKVGDRLGGHYVTGHIDTTGTVSERIDDEDWSTIWFSLTPRWTKLMVEKGSIAVDGVSLTVVDVESKRFSVALIPHTLEVTTLGQCQTGVVVNLETDLLAKYVQSQLEPHEPAIDSVDS
ncbi:MAG: riboflavin synthase [Pirellulaceae bacterium]